MKMKLLFATLAVTVTPSLALAMGCGFGHEKPTPSQYPARKARFIVQRHKTVSPSQPVNCVFLSMSTGGSLRAALLIGAGLFASPALAA
jgi:hypothetical protein